MNVTFTVIFIAFLTICVVVIVAVAYSTDNIVIHKRTKAKPYQPENVFRLDPAEIRERTSLKRVVPEETEQDSSTYGVYSPYIDVCNGASPPAFCKPVNVLTSISGSSTTPTWAWLANQSSTAMFKFPGNKTAFLTLPSAANSVCENGASPVLGTNVAMCANSDVTISPITGTSVGQVQRINSDVHPQCGQTVTNDNIAQSCVPNLSKIPYHPMPKLCIFSSTNGGFSYGCNPSTEVCQPVPGNVWGSMSDNIGYCVSLPPQNTNASLVTNEYPPNIVADFWLNQSLPSGGGLGGFYTVFNGYSRYVSPTASTTAVYNTSYPANAGIVSTTIQPFYCDPQGIFSAAEPIGTAIGSGVSGGGTSTIMGNQCFPPTTPLKKLSPVLSGSP